MPKLFIVAGASGAGKTFLLERTAKTAVGKFRSVRKLTTRAPRNYENADLQRILDLQLSQPEESVRKCDYFYPYGKHWYGIRDKDIAQTIAEGVNPIVIVRHAETIRKLKRSYPTAVVIWLQSALSGHDLKDRLEEQGRSDIEIGMRMERLQRDFHDYVSILKDNLVNHVLVNYYDPDTLQEQVDAVLSLELARPEPDPDFVFILISFAPDQDEAYEALKTSALLLEGRKIKVGRVDDLDQHPDYRITEKILSAIRRAGLVIADITGHRPNVFWELGYARGLHKPIITCAQVGTTLPFDLHDFHTIFYKTPIDLQKQMRHALQRHYRG